jgi:hypothetical protein
MPRTHQARQPSTRWWSVKYGSVAVPMADSGTSTGAPSCSTNWECALSELAAVGVTDTPGVLVADAGYWQPGADAADRRARNPDPDPA